LPPSEEVKAINKLYEKYDKKGEKVKKIIDLRKLFNTGLKQLATLLLEMYTKSLESQETWVKNGSNSKTPTNLYITTKEFTDTSTKLKQQLDAFKKSDNFKLIGNSESYCDKIIGEFKPSFFVFEDNKTLLTKICRLFGLYMRSIKSFETFYAYFNDNKKMTGGFFGRNPTPDYVLRYFKSWSESLKGILINLEKDSKDTEVLEQQLSNKPPAPPAAAAAPVVKGGARNRRLEKQNKTMKIKDKQSNKQTRKRRRFSGR